MSPSDGETALQQPPYFSKQQILQQQLLHLKLFVICEMIDMSEWRSPSFSSHMKKRMTYNITVASLKDPVDPQEYSNPLELPTVLSRLPYTAQINLSYHAVLKFHIEKNRPLPQHSVYRTAEMVRKWLSLCLVKSRSYIQKRKDCGLFSVFTDFNMFIFTSVKHMKDNFRL